MYVAAYMRYLANSYMYIIRSDISKSNSVLYGRLFSIATRTGLDLGLSVPLSVGSSRPGHHTWVE